MTGGLPATAAWLPLVACGCAGSSPSLVGRAARTRSGVALEEPEALFIRAFYEAHQTPVSSKNYVRASTRPLSGALMRHVNTSQTSRRGRRRTDGWRRLRRLRRLRRYRTLANSIATTVRLESENASDMVNGRTA